tara:strand:- start:51 stop:227 length:177 start_codon:yes stop_codon:yes gene_type:complete
MTDTSKKIVDAIHNGEMNDARDLVFQGMKEKAAEVVDMKRVETSTTWMDKQEDNTEEG